MFGRVRPSVWCKTCGMSLSSDESRGKGYCYKCDPGAGNGFYRRCIGGSPIPELKEGCEMRLGIDSRGNLFWRREGTRWIADPEDNDLMELKSILLEAKPQGGSFIVTNGRVHYRTTDGKRYHAEHVVLWFDPKQANWKPPISLSKEWTKEENEEFINRFSHNGRTN